MKKLLLLISSFCLISFNLHAQQQLPNSGFENWDNVGRNSEEPVHWSSNKTGGGFSSLGPQTCFREGANVYAGSYCVKLETGRIFGSEVNGTVTTGKLEAPSTNPNEGYSQTVRADPDFSEAFSSRPDSLVGYYRYTSVNGDAGALQVVLHGDEDVRIPDPNNTTSSFIIGEAAFTTPSSDVTNWTRFAVPFVYNNSDTPQYVLAVFTASADVAQAERGSTLWVDGIELVYNPPPCANTAASITLSACEEQTSPSGKYLWTTSGMYMDTIPNVGGCDSVITVNLTIDQLDYTISQLDGMFEAADLTADSYQWLNCDSSFAPVASATNAIFTPAISGNYAVEMRKGTCLDTSECLFAQVVSIDENAIGQKLVIGQGSTAGIYWMQVSMSFEHGSFELLSLAGQVLLQGEIRSQEKSSLNLTDLPSAVYVLRIRVDDQVGTVKLLR